MNCQSLDVSGTGQCRGCFEVSWSGKKSTLTLSLSGHGKFSGTCRTHTDGHNGELADLKFCAMINRDDLVRAGTCDSSPSVLRIAIQNSQDDLNKYHKPVYLLVYPWLLPFADCMTQARVEIAGQDRLAKAQDVLIKLVSLERAPMEIGRFDDGLS